MTGQPGYPRAYRFRLNPTLAQAIYTVLFGHIDSKFHRDEKLAEIEDWLREGDIEGYPQPETLAREYDEWGTE